MSRRSRVRAPPGATFRAKLCRNAQSIAHSFALPSLLPMLLESCFFFTLGMDFLFLLLHLVLVLVDSHALAC